MKHLSKKNKEGKDKDKVICDHCGNDTFKVYIRIIIDDARLFCSKCGKEWLG